MFRILIVEDIEDTLRELKELILSKFAKIGDSPRVEIDLAETVAEAERLIKAAWDRKRPYHAVILDFYLPKKEGLDAMEMDQSLCLLMRDLMPSTLVAHITAYPYDGPVKEHLRDIHQAQLDPRAFALSKLDVDYAGDLIRKLKAFLLGMRIEEQMEIIFGADMELSFAARGRMVPNRNTNGGSLTHSIASLTRDIEMYWKDLDMTLNKRLRERIERTFRVEEVNKQVRVSLLQKAER